MRITAPDMTPELLERLEEIFGEAVAYDTTSALFEPPDDEDMSLQLTRLRQIERDLGQTVDMSRYGEGQSVEVKGREYTLTGGEWKR